MTENFSAAGEVDRWAGQRPAVSGSYGVGEPATGALRIGSQIEQSGRDARAGVEQLGHLDQFRLTPPHHQAQQVVETEGTGPRRVDFTLGSITHG